MVAAIIPATAPRIALEMALRALKLPSEWPFGTGMYYSPLAKNDLPVALVCTSPQGSAIPGWIGLPGRCEPPFPATPLQGGLTPQYWAIAPIAIG